MSRIKILSPVHISTGKNIETPSYYVKNGIAYRYNFIDLLSHIPPNILLDEKILNEINYNARNHLGSKSLYNQIQRNVNYNSITPLYKLKCDLDYELADYAYDISEQVKELNRPYIPGSTIKGTIINAWIYNLLKQNVTNVQMVEAFLVKMKFHTKDSCILELLYPNINSSILSSFLKEIGSCILCYDLYFDDMQLYDADRVGAGKDNSKSMPLSYKECISSNQEIEQVFFKLDEKRIEFVKDKYKDYSTLINLCNFIKKGIILHSCNIYVQDMIDEEFSERNQILYEDYQPIPKQLLEIKKLLNQKSEDSKHFILRLGNSTNYNFKTISVFIKNRFPNLYEKYFDEVFSPVPKSKDGKKKVNYCNMPKTRVVLSDKNGCILPGFIMVTYDKKS